MSETAPVKRAKQQPNKKARAIAAAQAKLRAAQEELDKLTADKSGRPTLYRAEYAARATDLALLGLTNEEMAERFGVNIRTFEQWMREVPEFAGSIYEGREGADAKVARALFKSAVGYEHHEDDIRTISLGNNQGSEIVITPTIKHYPPNDRAIAMWLGNKQKKRFPSALNGGQQQQPGTPEEMARAVRAAMAAAFATEDDAAQPQPKDQS